MTPRRGLTPAGLVIALVLSTGAGAQSGKPAGRVGTTANASSTPNGMVISGDREGPLGLYLAPWQEPVAQLPEALLQTRLPKVIDDSFGLADDPVNRQFPAPEVARAAPVEPTEKAKPRRGRKEETPRPMIMRSTAQ